MNYIDTNNQETILESICNFLDIPKRDLEYYIMVENRLDFYRYYEEIDLSFINSYFGVSVSEYREKEVAISIFHLTRRIFENEYPRIYNLHRALIDETEIKEFFKRYDIEFLMEDQKISAFRNGKKIEGLSLINSDNEPTIRLIINRLEGNRFNGPDKCINGMLYKQNIVNEGDIKHLITAPEIVQNIMEVLEMEDSIKDFQYGPLYVVKSFVNINDFVFDQNDRLTKDEKLKMLLKMLLSYIGFSMYGDYNLIENPIIRVRDEIEELKIEEYKML